jgi:Crp-like helix-turn-helix domain
LGTAEQASVLKNGNNINPGIAAIVPNRKKTGQPVQAAIEPPGAANTSRPIATSLESSAYCVAEKRWSQSTIREAVRMKTRAVILLPSCEYGTQSTPDQLLVQICNLGICNNSHSIEQRLSRWRLMMQDRAHSSQLRFTQDAITGVLGTRRATISVAAAGLQNAGLIRYTPGSITIRYRRALERAGCGCYKSIQSGCR